MYSRLVCADELDGMFVEIVRLFIVFLGTAGGLALGRSAGDAAHGPIIGATLEMVPRMGRWRSRAAKIWVL